MKQLLIRFYILALYSISAFGQTMTNEQIQNAINEIGNKAVSTSVSVQKPSDFVPKYSESGAGNDLFGEGDVTPVGQGGVKITDCSTKALDSNLYNRQECESINFVSRNKSIRPNMTVTTTDPVITGNRSVVKDPLVVLDKYGYQYPKNSDGSVGTFPAGSCKPTTTTISPQYEERVCTDYRGAENFMCKQVLKYTVVPHFNYRCNDVLGENTIEKCSKRLVVRCQAGANNCAQSGVVPTSYDTDMKTIFTPLGGGDYKISYGVIGDQYWGGGSYQTGNFYYRHLKVNIKNKSQLTKFVLSRVDWDDWVIIRINGQIVFKDAEIEDRLEAVTSKNCPKLGFNSTSKTCLQIGPNKYAFAQHHNSWKANPNIELKQFLNEGENDIFVTVVVYDGGEFYSEFITQMFCPATCTEAWQNLCTTLEERAK